MAHIPTDEESGRCILKIFKNNGRRAGEQMLIQALTVPFQNQGGSSEDFDLGIQYLLEQQLIEKRNGKTRMYFLTQAGFEEM